MTTDEICGLPIAQKIEVMEALWEDLRERFDRAEVPTSVKRLLDERRERVHSGQTQLLDWDSARETIGRA